MEFYIISVTIDEWHSRDVYIATSYEEAKSKIMDYADWYCGYGTCQIRRINSHFNTLETWRFRKGELVY